MTNEKKNPLLYPAFGSLAGLAMIAVPKMGAWDCGSTYSQCIYDINVNNNNCSASCCDEFGSNCNQQCLDDCDADFQAQMDACQCEFDKCVFSSPFCC